MGARDGIGQACRDPIGTRGHALPFEGSLSCELRDWSTRSHCVQNK